MVEGFPPRREKPIEITLKWSKWTEGWHVSSFKTFICLQLPKAVREMSLEDVMFYLKQRNFIVTHLIGDNYEILQEFDNQMVDE